MASDRDAVAWRMRPGAWDERGFLGASEALGERIEADAELCDKLGTTPEALGNRLLDLLAEARSRAELEHDDEPDVEPEVEPEVEPTDAGAPAAADTAIAGAEMASVLGGEHVVEGETLVDEPDAVVEPTVTIRAADAAVGAVTCPWALEEDEVCLRGPGGNPSADRFTIVLGDATLAGYTLSAHLIACHRFFGGLDSCFRIDPAHALAVLDPG